MSTFLIRHLRSGRYVQLRPYDGAWTWLAPWASYANVFPQLGYAEAIAQLMEQQEPDCAEILEIDEQGECVRTHPVPAATIRSTQGAA